MSPPSDRRAGLLFGSFVAESLSLGVHWIYDPKEIVDKVGRIETYRAPGEDSYHPHKRAGDQGHVGDQSLALLHHLSRSEWNAPAFFEEWRAMWPAFDDYVDGATKSTLANLESGVTPSGAESDELAGPARIAPLLVRLAGADEDAVVQAAVEQTVLTHRSPATEEAATFLARAGHRLMRGADLIPTVEALAPAWTLEAARGVMEKEPVDAIGELGRSCPIPAALPSVIYLVLKRGDSLEDAFIDNAMAGGDNCARALALGLLLGAAHGVDAIPQSWRDNLAARETLHSFLQS